jgi:hypothetical protein
MNWKTNLLLVVLAAGAGAWLWKGDALVPRLAPKSAPPDPHALTALEADFAPASITRIEISPAGGDPFAFVRTEAGWTQSGGWPLLAVAVDELVEALSTLRTRFQPVPLPEGADLAAFGLADAQKPLAVSVIANGKPYALKFGEAPAAPGESPFIRPAFVRVGPAAEVLKLGPDVLPILRRPADAYRRRQLFPDIERVKVAGTAPAFAAPGMPPEPPTPNTLTLPGGGVTEVRVAGKSPKLFGVTPWALDGTFTLKRIAPTPGPTITEPNAEPTVQPDRLADVWALESPVRDRTDPAAVQRVLAAVPDLWVEKFVPAAEASFALDHPFAIAQLMPIPLEPFPAALVRLQPDVAVLAPLREKVPAPTRARMDKSEQSVTVSGADRRPVTVKFGGLVSVTREESETTPGRGPDAPPETTSRPVTVAHCYAQLEGNEQLFTVPADKVAPLFAKAGDLVESRVARFSTDEVRQVTIARPGKPPIVLTSKKGDRKSTKPEEREDRWFIERDPNPLLADSDRVREFVGRLASFNGDSESDLYRADPKARGLDPAQCVTVTVVVREKRPEKAPEAPAREYKILVGASDFAAGKLPVQLAGWPRITLVSDRVGAPPAGWLAPVLFPERLEPVFHRDPIAYRNRKLFDTTDTKLAGVSVDGASGFALKQEKVDNRDVWKLSAPLASDADPANAMNLVGQLANLQATEFLTESANPAEFGLDKPKFTAQLTFGDALGKQRTYKLEVGAARPGKQEVFARLDGGAVFALPTTTTEALSSGALKLLPLQVWSVPLDKLTAVEVARFETPTESFALANEANNWKLTAPFAAPVPYQNAQSVLAGLCMLPAEKYEALSAPDPAKYGFDKPFAKVKLTYTEKTPDGERPVTKAVVIGGVAPGGDRYAKLDDSAAPVFVLPTPYLFALGTSPLAFLDRDLLRLDAAKITKVQIAPEKPENAVTLVKDEKGAWKAEGAAFTVDALVAGQVVNTFAPLPVERLVAFGDAVKWADYGLDKPEYTITVTLGGDKPATHKLQIGKADPLGGRFVRVDDGKAVGVIRPDAVQALARTKLDFADRTLLAFKPEDLLGLARTKGKDEFELAPGGGDGWDVVKPAKQKADKVLVEDLAEALGRLRAEKVVAFGKKEEVFKEYGLEPPEATVTLTIGDKPKVLLFGKPVDAAKPDGEHYVTVETPGAEATVGVLSAVLSQQLLAPPVSFRDRTIVKFVDADKLELVRGPRKVTFAKVNATWKVTAPLASDAEQAALDDLVAELARLRAADWVAEKPTPAELKTFGLESPEATWTVSNADKVLLTLKLGKTAPDGRVYASAGTDGRVALLGGVVTAKVLGEYRVRKPWALDAFQAESVEITRGDKTFTLQKLGMAWVDPAAPDDRIDPRAITELLGGLTALRVERFAVDADGEPKLFGLEKPETTITVLMKDGARRVLEIGGTVGGTDDKQRYARVVDKGRSDVFILSAADTARFTRDRGVYVQKK